MFLVSTKKKKIQDQTINDDFDAETAPPDAVAPADEENNTLAAEEAETIQPEEENPLAVQLEQAEARAAEYLDSLQRERAAFQNYKRRVEREREEQSPSGGRTRADQAAAGAG